MDIKQAAHSTADLQPADHAAPLLRRRLLGAGLSGAAISLLPWLSGRASAQSSVPSTEPGSAQTPELLTVESTAGTTTTAPPRRPTDADIELLAVAQTLELAARDLYDVALAGAADWADADKATAVTIIREAHEAYAQSISGIIGRDAPNETNITLFDELKGDFSGDLAAVARAGASLENVLVATHIDILNALLGIDAAALLASVLVVEARHATVLNTFAGATDLAGQLASDGIALSINDYAAK